MIFHAQQKSQSLWQHLEPPVFHPLSEDLSTDVCVVGGGMAGLTTAYLLLKNGYRVVLLEKESFGQNETGLSTAHLSSVLDEGFDTLRRVHGPEGARLAYESHKDAIDLIEKIIDEEGIRCDFRRLDGLLVLGANSPVSVLETEYQAAQEIGIEDVCLETPPPGFPQLGPCLRYSEQAQFHPLRYLQGLLQAIIAMRGRVYNLTHAVEFQGGENAFVKTDMGFTVQAQHVVIATNVPVNDRYQIHYKEASYRTYVIGIDEVEGTFPDMLLWDTGFPYHYVRKTTSTRPGYETILIGGEDHRVGQDNHPAERYQLLLKWARQKLQLKGECRYYWSGQIVEPIDGLAYIGQNPTDHVNVYIACGDSGHGLTHGTIAGMIIRDLIQGNPNDWTKLYSPSRLHLRSVGKMMKESASTITQYEDRIYLRRELRKNLSEEDLAPEEGTLIQDGFREIAVYRDAAGVLHTFSALCPHLGGVVHWNESEKTWDCPCHGSRFACTGEVLNGPAISPLVPVTEIPEEILKMKKFKPKPAIKRR